MYESAGDTLIAYDLAQKNKYLSKKVERLREEKVKQSESIKKIKDS